MTKWSTLPINPAIRQAHFLSFNVNAGEVIYIGRITYEANPNYKYFPQLLRWPLILAARFHVKDENQDIRQFLGEKIPILTSQMKMQLAVALSVDFNVSFERRSTPACDKILHTCAVIVNYARCICRGRGSPGSNVAGSPR
jgi:hypothetical protein